MKYFVIDNLEEIKTIDQDALKERVDVEYIHDLKFISDKKNKLLTNYEVDCGLKLIPGNEYHVLYVEYDSVFGVNTSVNNISIVGIYNDIVLTNKIISAIKHNSEMLLELFLEDHIINPMTWKNDFSTLKKIGSISLKYKLGDR